MPLLQRAREVKHAAFVLRKQSRMAYRRTKFEAATWVFRDVERFRPYRYRSGRYPGSFLDHEPASASDESRFPRHVFVIWAGENEMSPARRRGLESLHRTTGLPVVLVTPENLDRWLVPGAPLHPAYEHLSLVHRSDYLRGYLMHHHGGGYCDVKTPRGSWAAAYDAMLADQDRWVTSYRTSHANWIGKLPGRLGLDILVHHRLMFGKSAFMMRSHTPITSAWMAEMDRRLDVRAEELARHPGGVWGDDDRYPLSWTDLLGRVLDPLTLKYLTHVGYDERLLLEFENYR